MKGRLLSAVFVAAAAFGAEGLPVVSSVETYEAAVLRNGFTIECVRHQTFGQTTRLWLNRAVEDEYLDLRTEEIATLESRQRTVPLPPPPEPAVTATTAAASPLPAKDTIRDLIAGVAVRHRIDPDFVASVVRAESDFNPGAVSPKGAGGLMQLMPQTAATLGVANVLDPAANLEGGTRYLRQLLDKYNGDAVKALAAYNAGPGRVEQYGGIPPFRETRDYISRIIADYNRKKLQQQSGK